MLLVAVRTGIWAVVIVAVVDRTGSKSIRVEMDAMANSGGEGALSVYSNMYSTVL